MYDPDKKCGVLTDFDLSLLQWEPRILGTDRTGTIPFMALKLLSDQHWNGSIKRYHYHELESFIWILPYVILSYQDGKRQRNKFFHEWETSNYRTCLEKKRTFYIDDLKDARLTVQRDFEICWPLAYHLCSHLRFFHIEQEKLDFLARLDHGDFKKDNLLHFRRSQDLWATFCDVLGLCLKDVKQYDFAPLLTRLEYYKPTFELTGDHSIKNTNTFSLD